MGETMQEAWSLVLNDPDFEFVPYYLGALAIAAIFAVRRRGRGWGDGGGGESGCGGGGGDGGE